MEKIYLVVVSKGDEMAKHYETVCAYRNKKKAEEKCNEMNWIYKEAIPINEYIDNEIELTNEISDSLDNQLDMWVDLTDAFVMEDLKGEESILKEWKYLKELYENVKKTFGDDYSFSKYLGYCMDEAEWKNDHTKVLFAKFMKVFCKDMRKYPIEKIETAVKLYGDKWSISEAIIKEVELF